MASAVKDVGKTFMSDPKHLKVRIQYNKTVKRTEFK